MTAADHRVVRPIPRPSARRLRAAIEPLERRRLMTAGVLDPTFGTGGSVQVTDTAAAGRQVAYSATAYQPDGRVLLVTSDLGATAVTVYRYTSGGDLDSTWGTNGVVTLTGGSTVFGTADDPQVAVAPNADVYVCAGSGAVRLTPTGTPDTTYGSLGTGYVAFTPAGGGSTVAGAALQADGKLVVTVNGNATGGGADAYVERFTTTGTPDTSFGQSGVTDLASSTYTRVDVGGLAIDPSGRIVVGLGVTLDSTTAASVGGTGEFGVVRLNTVGFADMSFGTNGTAVSLVTNDEADESAVAISPVDGTIYQGGATNQFLTTSLAFAESYSSVGVYNGQLGLAISAGGAITSVAVQSDGKPVVSGYQFPVDGTGTNFFAERFEPLTTAGTGTIDPTYATTGSFGGGVFTDSFTSGGAGAADQTYARGDRSWSIALEPDGTTYVAGTSIEGTVRFDLVRLGADDTLAAGVGNLSGTTYDDANSNGTRDAVEVGLANYPVFLDNNGDGTFDAGDTEVYTDAGGDYAFIGLLPGATPVVQPLAGTGGTHTQPAAGDAYTPTVIAGSTVSGLDFGVAGATTPTPTPSPTPTPTATASGSIIGTCFLDNNGDGTRGPLEPGLFGWGVFLDNNNDGALDTGDTRVFTDATGAFAFTALAAGTYHLRQNTPAGYVHTTAAFPVNITVALGQTAVADIGNQFVGSVAAPGTGGQITGFVFDDSNADGVRNDGEAGIAGRIVYLDNNNDGVDDAGDTTFTTDADGQYTFNGLAAGTYHLRLDTPAGDVLTTAAFPVDTTVTTTTVRLVNIGLRQTGTGAIAGTVFLDTNGNGVQNGTEPGLNGFGVFLDLNNNGTFDGTDVRVFTTTTGQYTFGSLTPGTYRVRENIPAGYTLTTAAFPRVVTVTADGVVTVNIGYQFG